MKKLLASTIAAAILSTSLVGCSKPKEEPKSSAPPAAKMDDKKPEAAPATPAPEAPKEEKK